MSVQVKNNYVGIAPRKIRLVCDLIRNQKASKALEILRYCPKKEIAVVLTKLINSGLTIATERNKYDIDNLIIGAVMASDGPRLKRIRPRAQGRAFRILKRTSHITLELKEK